MTNNRQFKLYFVIVSAVLMGYVALTLHDQVYEPTSWPEQRIPYLVKNAQVLEPQKEFFHRDSFRDHPLTLVNFWASWCGVCEREAVILSAMARSNPNLHVLGVITDDTGNTVVESGKLDARPYDHLIDFNGRIFESLNISGLPTTLLIDNGGNIIGRFDGLLRESDQVALKKLMKVRSL